MVYMVFMFKLLKTVKDLIFFFCKNHSVLTLSKDFGNALLNQRGKHHPYFVATQAHPEFKSRPNRAHPLFVGLVQASLERQESNRLFEVKDA